MVHHLKILPKYYLLAVKGIKRFEIRKDDRDYKKGDYLLLKEYSKNEYTGNAIKVRVVHVLKDIPQYGLKKGFVLLSFDF